jgi:hypothetical protein
MNEANSYKIEIIYSKPITKPGHQELVMRSYVTSDIKLSDRELSVIGRRWRDSYLPSVIEMTNGEIFVMEDELHHAEVIKIKEPAFV